MHHATRRDQTFLKLQEAEQRMQDAARDVRSLNKANARLPRHLRLTPGQVMVKEVAQKVMGKILTVRRDRLATKFMDEATLSALQQVAEATSPTQGKAKTNRPYDQATAPDLEDLAALHAAVLEEIEAQRLGARNRKAWADAREAELTKEWKSQSLGPRPRSPSGGPAGPTPTGPGPMPKPPTPGGQTGNAEQPGRKPDAARPGQQGDPRPNRPNIHGVIRMPGPTRPAWLQTRRKSSARDEDTAPDVQAQHRAFMGTPSVPEVFRALHRKLLNLREQFRGDGAGFTAAVLADQKAMIEQHAASRARLAALREATQEMQHQPAPMPAAKGPLIQQTKTQTELADAGKARREQITTASKRTPHTSSPITSSFGAFKARIADQAPAHLNPTTLSPIASSPGTTTLTTGTAPHGTADPALPVPRATRVMHGARIADQPPASLDRDPQPATTAATPPATDADNARERTRAGPSQNGNNPRAKSQSLEPGSATPSEPTVARAKTRSGSDMAAPSNIDGATGDRTVANLTAPAQIAKGAQEEPRPEAQTLEKMPETTQKPDAASVQTPDEAANEAERKRRRKAILAARKRNQGQGI